ncbi:MAG: hypothetical protein K0R61_2969 [Microvirga sp.]|jgi:hypothetical protein|nr:hypothetical protein [Microvirga sp.]
MEKFLRRFMNIMREERPKAGSLSIQFQNPSFSFRRIRHGRERRAEASGLAEGASG